MMILAAWTLTFFFGRDVPIASASVDGISTKRYCRVLGRENEQPGVRWRCRALGHDKLGVRWTYRRAS